MNKTLKNYITKISIFVVAFIALISSFFGLFNTSHIAFAEDENIFTVSGSGSIAYKTSYDLDGFDAEFPTDPGSWKGEYPDRDVLGTMGDGAFVSLKKGDVFTINNVDLSDSIGATSFANMKEGSNPTNVMLPGLATPGAPVTPFLGFAFYPSNFSEGQSAATAGADARKFVVRVTAADYWHYDITWVLNEDGSGSVVATDVNRATTLSTSANVALYGNGIRSNINGAIKYTSDATQTSAGLITQLFCDGATNSFSGTNAQSFWGNAYGQWLGQMPALDLTNNLVNISMWFEDYDDSDTASFYVFKVKDVNIRDAAIRNPQINLDLGGYTETSLPAVNVGETFTVFTATVGGGSLTSISVKDPDGEAVTLVDNKFTVDKYGEYTITYIAEDEYGEGRISRKEIKFTAKKVYKESDIQIDKSNMVISYGEGKNGLNYGETLEAVTVSGLVVKDLQGQPLDGQIVIKGANQVPAVPSNGTTVTALVEFVPSNTNIVVDYLIPIQITVFKAVPVVDQTVTCDNTDIVLGDTLSFSYVFRDMDGFVLAGSVTLKEELIVGTKTYTWVFTPDDSSYEILEGSIELSVRANQQQSTSDSSTSDSSSSNDSTSDTDSSDSKKGCSGSIGAMGGVALFGVGMAALAMVRRKRK